jgi:hypothetical protein
MRVCHLQHHYGQTIQQAGGNVEVGVGGMADLPKSVSGKMQALSREARSNQRRLLTAFGIDTDSDLLKFNQLKVDLCISYCLVLKKVFCSLHIVDLKLLVLELQVCTLSLYGISHLRTGNFNFCIAFNHELIWLF